MKVNKTSQKKGIQQGKKDMSAMGRGNRGPDGDLRKKTAGQEKDRKTPRKSGETLNSKISTITGYRVIGF